MVVLLQDGAVGPRLDDGPILFLDNIVFLLVVVKYSLLGFAIHTPYMSAILTIIKRLVTLHASVPRRHKSLLHGLLFGQRNGNDFLRWMILAGFLLLFAGLGTGVDFGCFLLGGWPRPQFGGGAHDWVLGTVCDD